MYYILVGLNYWCIDYPKVAEFHHHKEEWQEILLLCMLNVHMSVL